MTIIYLINHSTSKLFNEVCTQQFICKSSATRTRRHKKKLSALSFYCFKLNCPCGACRGEARQSEDGSVAIKYKDSPQSTPPPAHRAYPPACKPTGWKRPRWENAEVFLIFLSGLSALCGDFFSFQPSALSFELLLLSASIRLPPSHLPSLPASLSVCIRLGLPAQ
jgi:hypothetical protein